MPENILASIAAGSSLIPLFIGIINHKRLKRDSMLACGLVLIMVIQTGLLLIPGLMKCFVVFNDLYSYLEFAGVFLLFYPKFSNPTAQKCLRVSAIFYVFYCLSPLLLKGYVSFTQDLIFVGGFFYLFWIILLLKQEYGVTGILMERDDPFTWYLLGITVYNFGTLVVYTVWTFANLKHASFFQIWKIMDVSLILQYLFFSLGLLIRKEPLNNRYSNQTPL